MSSIQNLSVQVGGREFQLSGEPEEHDTLRAAADMLNDELSTLQENSGGMKVTLETGAVILALNFAAEHLRQQSRDSEEDLSPRIAQLIENIDSVLVE